MELFLHCTHNHIDKLTSNGKICKAERGSKKVPQRLVGVAEAQRPTGLSPLAYGSSKPSRVQTYPINNVTGLVFQCAKERLLHSTQLYTQKVAGARIHADPKSTRDFSR